MCSLPLPKLSPCREIYILKGDTCYRTSKNNHAGFQYLDLQYNQNLIKYVKLVTNFAQEGAEIHTVFCIFGNLKKVSNLNIIIIIFVFELTLFRISETCLEKS